MFDIGFLELVIIGIVALIVVGPKDLPGMFRSAGRFMGKMRAMAREFQRSMEEAADDSGLREAASAFKSTGDLGLNSATRSARSYAKKILDEKDELEAEAEAAADIADHASAKDKPNPAKGGTAGAKPRSSGGGDDAGPDVATPSPSAEPAPAPAADQPDKES